MDLSGGPPGRQWTLRSPIRFKDAVGRTFSFPFQLCATWAGMEEFIQQAFLHDKGIGPHVMEGHYDLIGPDGKIIHPREWETMVKPGWNISMRMWPMPAAPARPPPLTPSLPPSWAPGAPPPTLDVKGYIPIHQHMPSCLETSSDDEPDPSMPFQGWNRSFGGVHCRYDEPCDHGLWKRILDKTTCPLSKVVKSRADGYLACNMLLFAVEEYRPEWRDEESGSQPKRLIQGYYSDGSNDIVTFRLFEDKGAVGAFQLLRRPKVEPLYPIITNVMNQPMLRFSLNITTDTRSQESFNRVAKWLSHCYANCTRCKQKDPSFKPRRLLDVGPFAEADKVVLFESTTSVSYVCLSYCWGSDTKGVLTTTRLSREAHYEGILLTELPQTIRDAIAVCRGIKIRYLWVDSLCIIQDDTQDFLKEAARMLQIYTNSELTIYADASDGCKKGFLGSQKYGSSHWQRPLSVTIPAKLGNEDDELILRTGERDMKRKTDRYPLEKRGWCLQEIIASNRKVIFTGNEMEWRCTEFELCECGHAVGGVGPVAMGELARRGPGGEGITERFKEVEWKRRYNILDSVGSVQDRYSHRYPLTLWRDLVEEYSQRSLTRETDKLSAISGLAKMASKAQPGKADVYLTGLWRDSFISDLAWSIDRSNTVQQHRRQSDYRAPTWSWASIDGPIRYDYYHSIYLWSTGSLHMKITTVVEKFFCSPLSDLDPTGPIKGDGYAVLRAPFAPVQLILLKETSAMNCRSSVRPRATQRSDTTERVFLIRGIDKEAFPVDVDFESDLCLQDTIIHADECYSNDERNPDEFRLQQNAEQLYVLQLFVWEDHESQYRNGRLRVGRNGPETWFLLLRQCPATKGAYERMGIGFWNYQSRADYPYWIRHWLRARLARYGYQYLEQYPNTSFQIFRKTRLGYFRILNNKY